MARGEEAVDDAYVKRMARQWRKRCMTLEILLEDLDLDTWADFWCVSELEAMEEKLTAVKRCS